MRDSLLLKKLNSDPETGISLLIKEYGGLVYSVVRSKLSPNEFCEDDVTACVSDVFSEFYLGLKNYSPQKGSIRSYLCVIAKNNALDILRHRYKDSVHIPIDCNADNIPSDFFTDEIFENHELRCELALNIASLGKPDNEIIFRKYYLEQSSKEIAKILGMTVSNVDTRTHRALNKLRKQMGGIKK